MADWHLVDGQALETGGVTSAASTGLAVTGAGSTNTKGSWTELIAATARDAFAVLVNLHRGGVSAVDVLVDIGIGGAGSEQVLIPNLKGDVGTSLTTRAHPLVIPIQVPKGSRISARVQATSASVSTRMQVFMLSGGWAGQPGMGRVTDYGTNTADSGGVAIDPGAVLNTKGSWTQITASTTKPGRHLLIGIGNGLNSARVATDWLLDVAIGGSGSEQIILADCHVEAAASDDLPGPTYIGPFPFSIPAGTRIAARSQCSINDANDRLFDLIAYGVS